MGYSPDGSEQTYGIADMLAAGAGLSGGIDINVLNPEPDWMEKEIYVGAWVTTYSEHSGFEGDYARVRFSLHMDPDPEFLPAGLVLYSPWYENLDAWLWKEWYISEVEPGVPLPCLDFNINIEFEIRGSDYTTLTLLDARVDGVTVQHICVPEPTTLSLLALGGLALRRRRR